MNSFDSILINFLVPGLLIIILLLTFVFRQVFDLIGVIKEHEKSRTMIKVREHKRSGYLVVGE